VQGGFAIKRVLVIACSQRKLPHEGLLPAIERYDGPAFRVLRKFIREHEERAPDVFILSAKYGFISLDHHIPDYDVRLPTDSVEQLRRRVAKEARKHLAGKPWDSVGICAGRDYRSLLDAVIEELDQDRIHFIAGGQGSRLSALKNWLLRTI
jgi:hypothetical protein